MGSALPAADVASLTSLLTLRETDLPIFTTLDGSVMVGEAMVVQSDIQTSNGVIHLIDTVLVPPASLEEN